MPESQALLWWRASRRLGIRGPEDLYLSVSGTIDPIVAALAYAEIMALWRYCRRSKHGAAKEA